MTQLPKRVTPEDIDNNIHSAHYFTAAQGIQGATPPGLRTAVPPESTKLMTICTLVLKNGFIVIGHSACADPASYSQEVGEQIALRNAKDQIWPLMGYLLKQELSQNV